MKIIKDLMSYLRTNNLTLIPPIVGNTYDYLSDYVQNFINIDNYFNRLYSNLLLIDSDFTTDSEYVSYLQNLIVSNFIINNYKYETLYKTITAVYDPIENYNRMGKTTTTHSPVTNTLTYGEKHNTSITDPKTDTTTEKISSFDNDNFKPNTENSVNYGTNKLTYTDSEHVDTSTTTEYTDTIEDNIHGNIGVTTTQQMLQSEREIAFFTFYSVIFNDITDIISKGVWDL